MSAELAGNALSNGRRARFLDATRGVAMLMVLLAHFRWIYFERNPGHSFTYWMNLVTMVAAPTFMLISGMLLGFVYQTRPARFAGFRVKLIDRGLFLLTFGHLVILLAYLNYAGGLRGALRYGQILDAVGLAIIGGPWLIARTSAGTRALLAVLLLTTSWALIAAWQPTGTGPDFVKDTLVGGGAYWSYNFPILPWLALYLVGTALGQGIGARLADGNLSAVRAHLVRLGIASVLSAGVLKAVQIGLSRMGLPAEGSGRDLLYQMTSPIQHLPPAPAYFLFYGGAGLLLMAAIVVIDQRPAGSRWLQVPIMLGRNSLFIFLLQEHLYVGILWTINPPYDWGWPLLFLATAAIAVAITAWWDRSGLTRWLTVGYGRRWGPRESDPALAAS